MCVYGVGNCPFVKEREGESEREREGRKERERERERESDKQRAPRAKGEERKEGPTGMCRISVTIVKIDRKCLK